MAKKSSIFPIIAIVLCVVLASSALRGRKDAADSSCEHIYGEAVTLKQAKCEEEGATKQECLICGEIKVEKIPSKGGHVFVEKSVLIEPTCAQAGAVKKECAVCKETTIDRLPTTDDHVYDGGVEMEESILYTCTLCGKTKTGELHKHEDLDFSGTCDVCDAPFDALANATEVEVVDGEYVAGNWYRFYRPKMGDTRDGYYQYTLNIPWKNSNFEPEIYILIKFNESTDEPNNYIQCMGPMGTTFVEMKTHITDEYIDLYFEKGIYTSPDNYGATAEIKDDTTITITDNWNDGSAFIKRLVLD